MPVIAGQSVRSNLSLKNSNGKRGGTAQTKKEPSCLCQLSDMGKGVFCTLCYRKILQKYRENQLYIWYQ